MNNTITIAMNALSISYSPTTPGEEKREEGERGGKVK